ncbi:hypothetical protein [Anaerospora hongkongensis]|uniref:hypothetical protein n=1 Tax=Anaerospora hongkongensis TaxID=244830 RepID=UPI0028A09B77|nr:hypothetical protein [Anaerospora hongkongensis]
MSKKLLLGYTVVNEDYTKGEAGAIIQGAGGVTDIAVNKSQVVKLNKDPSLHSFQDAATPAQLRVALAQYKRVQGGAHLAADIGIYDPSANPWTMITQKKWNHIENLYGVVTLGDSLYGIDYDGARIVRIAMTGNGYTETGSYTYPGTAGYQSNGVAIAAVDGYLYGLFTTVNNPWIASPQYLNSTVVKLDAGLVPVTGGQVSVGKNAFTLEPFTTVSGTTATTCLYVACIGGKQNFGSHNPDSCLDVVDLSTMTAKTAFKAGAANDTSDQADFRDITFGNDGTAYILTGRYNADFETLSGMLYKTSAADILARAAANQPALLSQAAVPAVSLENMSGFFWAILYDNGAAAGNDRLWFARGNDVAVYNPPPGSTQAQPFVSLTPERNLGLANLNSVAPFWEAVPVRRAYRSAPRSLASHSRMAKQAREAALVCKAGKEQKE